MKTKKFLTVLSLLALLSGCSDDKESGPELATGLTLRVTSSITQQFSGDIESVRVVEGRSLPSAIAVASKTKTIRYLENDGTNLKSYLRDLTVIYGDEDSELTNSAVYDEKFVFATLTDFTKNSEGKVTECSDGKLVLITNDELKYGFKAANIGPMPDAVAISPDKRYIITADEYDGVDAWGKCPIGNGAPGLSIFDLDAILDHGEYKKSLDHISSGELRYSKQIKFTHNALNLSREPEYIAIASDSDTVAVTLQDSYEVAIFKLSEIMAKPENILDESDIQFVDIPANSAGIKSWPDGIVAFDIGASHYFAMAGEGSDSIIIIDDKGTVVSNTEITEKEVPTNYPCLKDDDFAGTKYSPDSITAFELNSKTYVAATLRYAGAVIIYDVSTPSKPVFEMIMRAGVGDVVGNGVCTKDNTSRVYPEGISSGKFGDAVYIWVANEGDSSVSSIKIEAK